ncbi:HAD family hydrolase [Natronobacterium gregoryi]|uniref:HAD family hydrolase n=2 Tax=Natronobacterium gregoryi TaxID=44930 RepID=L0AHK4_NATGS|nr:HAD-IA family hydrolase [Natronobacterium gregoryi]AFZ73286.1 haloacid dehalogenase superfamily enzyme, subfamily IA [Natronobacterium gregoryi SP2]ELY73930.1 HAD-superfamily hydrolase [Natronobacterium gregoryi SP2]PLK19917.1 HAD family hydrolase [Natronobacterium gregoryi SP2]SFJ38282.1 haloacid dehalogenase superfamily, subfamily IA, variant 1 with third motif having Dx(3-4)D or Dx(3-4)E [Natronobacterium gregoryi]
MGTAYDAIVFDNDGVLTTPTDYDVLIDAVHDAFVSVGVPEPPTDHVETLISPDVPTLRRVANEHGLEPNELWNARERAAIDAQLEEMRAGRKRPYDDVAALVALETPTAIVSNNQHRTIENVLEEFELTEYGFDIWYGREPTVRGIERKKPTPYYLESAIEELGASNPLYVGDSQVDVLAADNAGVDSAFIRRDHRLDYELSVEPEYEIESLSVLPNLV